MLIFFLHCPIMCLYVLSSMLGYRCSLPFPQKQMFGLSLPPFVVGRLVSYIRYLRLFAHSLVQHILCCAFCFLSSSCVPYVDSFSGLSIFD
jgi:hypothetical protein